jgi:hypothetical protein
MTRGNNAARTRGGARRLVARLASATLSGALACDADPRGADDPSVASSAGVGHDGPSSSDGSAGTPGDGHTTTTGDTGDHHDPTRGASGASPVQFDLGDVPDLGELPSLPSHCDAIDLLFVIDDSYSMADEQANLVASVPSFIIGITELLGATDYRVGVVTTDDYAFNAPGCRRLGDLVTQTGGEASSAATCGPFADGQPFMTDADDLAASFACTAAVGISGASDEKPMDALDAVLTRHGSPCSAGFVRDDALLVIVLITDEEDDGDSDRDPGDWYDTVVAAKDGDASRVMVLSLIGLDEPNACAGPWDGATGAEYAPRLAEFTEHFAHGVVGDVCAADYGPYFAALLADVATECTGAGPPG